jgi:hypothetical protein
MIDDKLKLLAMVTRRAALKLEILGMKRSRSPSAYIIIKRAYGITGNRPHVLEQLEIIIAQEKEAQERNYANVQPIK